MNILVTGALGHIGSRLIRSLPEAFPASQFTLVDNLSAQRYNSLFNLRPAESFRFIEADIGNVPWEPIVAEADVVVHLAALTDAANSVDRRDEVFSVNLRATERLARACHAHDVPLLFPSTTSVYGSQSAVVDEDCPPYDLKPQSPYAESKLAAERSLLEMAQKDGLNAVILRLGTIVGVSPGMRFHTAVNKFCWQAANGLPLTVWKTALHQKRPYLDLHDAEAAITHIIRRSLFNGHTFNVVTENLTVQDIVQSIRYKLPNTQVNLVDSPIMNQLSYEVRAERISAAGFKAQGDVEGGIGDTLALLSGLISAPKLTDAPRLST